MCPLAVVRFLVVLLALAVGVPRVAAQGMVPPGFTCAEGSAQALARRAEAAAEPRTVAPLASVVRALVVFVRFSDDDRDNAFVPCWRPTADREQPPPFAEALFEPYAEGRDPRTFRESTLTDFFYQQSKNSRRPFLLFGDVWPRDASGAIRVMVPEHPEAHYLDPGRGLWTLVAELLDRLDATTDLDFRDYDVNGDGVLDQLVLIVRSTARYASHGVGSLTGSPLVGGSAPEARVYDGVRVDWRESGQIDFVMNQCFSPEAPETGRPDAVSVAFGIAHEMGHALIPELHDGHLYPVFANGLPTNELYRPPSTFARSYDYAMMAGAPYPYSGGAKTMSVHERERLGWLAPTVLDRDRRGLVLGDLYTTGDAASLDVGRLAPGAGPTGGLPRRLLLGNRQRVGWFDRARRTPLPGVERPLFEGLKTTGLAVELVQDLPPGEPLRTSFDIVPADGTLEASSFEDDYAGDLFGPATTTQLTPWTRPNVNGCYDSVTSWPCNDPAFRPSFAAIDDIRDAGDGKLALDVWTDWRLAPEIVVREDSWIGPETAGPGGTVLTPRVRVTSGATLTVTAGTSVLFAAGVEIAAGARFVCEPGASCVQGDGVDPLLVPSRAFAPFPNPTRGALRMPLALAVPAEVSAVVVDALGREVARVGPVSLGAGPGEVPLDLSHQPPGAYAVRLAATPERGPAWSHTERVLVVR